MREIHHVKEKAAVGLIQLAILAVGFLIGFSWQKVETQKVQRRELALAKEYLEFRSGVNALMKELLARGIIIEDGTNRRSSYRGAQGSGRGA